ncbi:16S rRNA (uracil(1498)-N(3))-methyltransferase [Boudabousia liubingyangii]|uniref:Ribosomal RNA small subunit methyltransferase E n=1 Tax=Boudabousia liubingyangii TaxID=1921764 RepID=A0A1Q5PMW5_9ACTO|nr:16S rRNA (uracil(1498)-N(3))-methyltransferase [Boudabousia liubingyangii]OKL48898.1 16S rRNA (uracil(1498)-N(3))-methyltransferase [Boudabousia liubingyangii]
MTSPVFYLENPAQVAPGSTLVLTGAEAKHAHVMRIQAGDQIDLVDGNGLRYQVTVSGWQGNDLQATVDNVETETPSVRFVLVQGLAKGGRDEQALETATEVGVHRVVPWESQRSIVKAVAQKAQKLQQKWTEVTKAAMKQSRRSYWPEVDLPVNSKQLIKQVQEATAAGATVYVLHESATETLTAKLRPAASEPKPVSTEAAPTGPTESEIWFLVGPEGGITDDELDALTQAGAQTVRLGPTVLRAATAGTVALTLIQGFAGHWD